MDKNIVQEKFWFT